MIRVAVLGAGHWGPNLIRSFHTHQASEVAWVVDVDAERIAQVRSRYPDVRVSSRAGGRAARSGGRRRRRSARRPSRTTPLARAALEAGKHVLVEKPITTRSDQAEELCRLAEAKRRVLLVGHIFLYNAAVRFVKRSLDAGELGRVYYIVDGAHEPRADPRSTSTRPGISRRTTSRSSTTGWAAPPAASPPAAAPGSTPGIEDAVFATLRYADGVLVNLHASWLNPKKAREITVVGDRRMLTVDDMNLSRAGSHLRQAGDRGAGAGRPSSTPSPRFARACATATSRFRA